MGDAAAQEGFLSWAALPPETRELLTGRLAGLWEHPTDEAAFDSWPLDKKQGMLLLLDRIYAKGLWDLVRRVTNIWGEDGVGLEFEAEAEIESTLSHRDDFTHLFAKHDDTDGGFYEKDRDTAILHFLFREGESPYWAVHFDLYSPINSPKSAFKHLRHEFLGGLKPDWCVIAEHLNA